MAIISRSPTRLAGACINSGSVNTGETNLNNGGGQAATIYSGILTGPGLVSAPGAVANGTNVLFYSGAGRLNNIIPIAGISGVTVQFYDAAVATSGGPFALSGHKVIGVLQGNTLVVTQNAPIGKIETQAPFQSGLCAAVLSGSPGFTITFTPETNPTAGIGN